MYKEIQYYLKNWFWQDSFYEGSQNMFYREVWKIIPKSSLCSLSYLQFNGVLEACMKEGIWNIAFGI